MKLPKPKHGDSQGRHLRHFNIPPRTFQARNGEGLCAVYDPTPTPTESRYCSRCKRWIQIEGVVAFFQADYVGCLECGKPWPRSSRTT